MPTWNRHFKHGKLAWWNWNHTTFHDFMISPQKKHVDHHGIDGSPKGPLERQQKSILLLRNVQQQPLLQANFVVQSKGCAHLFSVSTFNRQCRWCWSEAERINTAKDFFYPLVIEAVRTKRRLWWFVKAPNCRAAPQHHWSPRKAMERPREALQGQEYHVWFW